jgi:hypothetical protein
MRLERRWRPSVLAVPCLGLALLLAGPRALAREQASANRQQHALVSVLDKNNAPVTGLTVPDFTVREDDVAREVIGVAPAPVPAHIVVLVDDSQSMSDAIPYLRDGLKGFIARLSTGTPAPQIRLMTFGDRPTLRSDFTTSASQLQKAADRIFAQSGAGSRFLEAVVETGHMLRTKRIADAAIVALVNEASPEFSEDSRRGVEEALRTSGATLWAAVVQSPRGAGGQSTEGRERAMVLGDTTRDSGGINLVVLGAQGVASALPTLATALTARYDVTYGRPDRLIPPTRLAVDVRDQPATVAVRRWAPQ